MKTLLVRNRGRHEIRAIATGTADGGRDPCAVFKFFQVQKDSWPEEMTKLAALLTDISKNGLPQPHDDAKVRKLGGTDGLYEFKSSGSGLRLMWFWDESFIICTHGWVKGGQKAPKQELDRGRQIKRYYFEAKKTGALIHVKA